MVGKEIDVKSLKVGIRFKMILIFKLVNVDLLDILLL